MMVLSQELLEVKNALYFFLGQLSLSAHMIRKGQLSEENMPTYKQFIALAG
jgi:hypothetical protein